MWVCLWSISISSFYTGSLSQWKGEVDMGFAVSPYCCAIWGSDGSEDVIFQDITPQKKYIIILLFYSLHEVFIT
jgi:hypothetical protein